MVPVDSAKLAWDVPSVTGKSNEIRGYGIQWVQDWGSLRYFVRRSLNRHASACGQARKIKKGKL
jgi:hypothetical protein